MAELKQDSKKLFKNGKIIGIVLMIISLAFIAREITKIDFRSIELQDPWVALWMILLFSCIQITTVFLNGWVYKLILEFFHGGRLSAKQVFKVYAKANVGKYLPGNVMHFAGRNLLGSRLGWKHSDILISTLLEIMFAFASSCIISIILSYSRFIEIMQSVWEQAKGSNLLIPALALGAVLVAIAVWLVIKNDRVREKLEFIRKPGFWLLFVKAFLIYILYFMIPGTILVLIYQGILGLEVTISSIVTIISASVLSWLAGFITIGAPGGLGVRESILLLMLGSLYGRGNTLVAALIHRLISILGDVGAFLVVSFGMAGEKDAELEELK